MEKRNYRQSNVLSTLQVLFPKVFAFLPLLVSSAEVQFCLGGSHQKLALLQTDLSLNAIESFLRSRCESPSFYERDPIETCQWSSSIGGGNLGSESAFQRRTLSS